MLNEYERLLVSEILSEVEALTGGKPSPQLERICKITDILLREEKPNESTSSAQQEQGGTGGELLG